MQDIRKKLEALRRVSNDGFSPAKGYDMRKPLSRSRIRTIEKYYDKLRELESRPHIRYKPKRGEKTEVFEYTGQKGMPKFNVGFVHKPNPEAKLKFTIDKSRPKGSRFVPLDTKTQQRYYHIPANVFLMADDAIFPDIIRHYAPDAEFFLIQAGEAYMWGAGGGPDKVSEKINKILTNYGASMFNANDRKSSYYGNWFRGVTGFTDRYDSFPMMSEAADRARKRRQKYKLKEPAPGERELKYRMLKDGSVGTFQNGELIARGYLS